ncbi:class I SAM-dependent RNA methyltransferase [Actinokineospora auranticolor]|uniref:tRNA/tmRNA/rRNA uracil-C5-methylase (TrmA/RlmC/RlmD family) n=1 Tax=Actinokineospora auranticolor TaxID=155976 RepID=A0A2S6GHL0_9PSEU|nr:class I SAM-dependent RNA methyltransferase [Actinokineospora auranticolor]PPK64651.1 tRNA/tmRNA/rRNA uracil-C5-methylase (TrmA/RlmC/RlmD family) [Actinokineospora auranticolor]
MTDWTGRRFEVEVGAVAHGGHCVARAEGRVVFVRHALPGERVVVAVTEDKGGSFCRGDAVEVLDASPSRVDPPCPLAAPGGCGGCDWQHASADEQRRLKAAVVTEQLSRLAGLEWDVEVEELAGGLAHWRTRTRLAVDRRGKVGFRAHRSHRVVPVDECVIAAPGTVDALAGREWTPGAELDVSVDATGRTHASELLPDRGKLRSGKPVLRPHRVLGSSVAVEQAARREWRLAAHGFWQVHPDAADVLAEVVDEWAGLTAGQVAWDLYAGVGLFAAVLGAQVGAEGTVVAVESALRAAEDAADNLADLPQVRVFAGKVEDVLADGGLPDPDAVVLDPPRKGAGRAVVNAIAARAPSRLVYVACDPAALARDVATFADHGYRLSDLRAFDTFPMTHHVECVALLSR